MTMLSAVGRPTGHKPSGRRFLAIDGPINSSNLVGGGETKAPPPLTWSARQPGGLIKVTSTACTRLIRSSATVGRT